MAGGGATVDPAAGPHQYSPLTGLIYIFNLIVGTGALTLPAAFHDAGWALSTAILCVLAFMSFLTATFIIEAMASANAMVHWSRRKSEKRESRSERQTAKDAQVEVLRTVRETSSPLHRPAASAARPPEPEDEGDDTDEHRPLLVDRDVDNRTAGEDLTTYYQITETTELGRMTALFFSGWGQTGFYVCLAVYLYGDLAIYAAAISKSVRDVACTFRPDNSSSARNVSEAVQCWAGAELTRLDAYRIVLGLFVCTVGQFVFCNVTKTKYLQIITSIMRWLAFLMMVSLACINISKNQSDRPTPPSASISGLPNLFGVCVYSFMCHHSLPSLITPISRKQRLYSLLLADYSLILAFYALLAFTGIYAFKEINDLYTLNFQPSESDTWVEFSIHYFLSLFPVFTLSTNFPIIALTLSNNLKNLFLREGVSYSWCTRTLLFPLLTLAPPTCVALATHSLEFLVGLTGSYAGAAIQYIVPATLVYSARKASRSALGVGVENPHRSPFKSVGWVIFVLIWAVTCIGFVTLNHIAG